MERTLVISRRRSGLSAVVSRAPFDPLVPLDLTPWIESGDLLPGDVVRIDVRPPFHVVGHAQARELVIHGEPAMDAASLSTAPHATVVRGGPRLEPAAPSAGAAL